MKTLNEIKEYCQTICSHQDCKGNYLKLAKKNITCYGITIVQKGQYYCDYKPGNIIQEVKDG